MVMSTIGIRMSIYRIVLFENAVQLKLFSKTRKCGTKKNNVIRPENIIYIKSYRSMHIINYLCIPQDDEVKIMKCYNFKYLQLSTDFTSVHHIQNLHGCQLRPQK